MPRSRTDHAPTPREGRSPLLRTAAIATGVVAVTVGGLYVAGLVTAGDDISAGTSVAGVDVGGMSRAEARAKLAAEAPAAWSAPIPVQVGDREATVSPATAGLTVDVEKTAELAADPSRDPVTVIGRLFSSGEREIRPVFAYDEAKAKAAVAELAKENDRKVREGSVAFRGGEAVATRAVTGQKLETDRAVETLRAAYPAASGASAVTLPVTLTEPKLVDAEVTRFLDTYAKPAVSGPVTLTAGAERLQISPATLGDHLSVKTENGRLSAALDSEALLRDPDVAEPLAAMTGAPVEATLGVRDGKVVVESEGRPGQEVTAKALGDAVRPLLTKDGAAARTATVATKVTQPELTADSLARLGITEQMSTFTVDFPTAPYRTTNIGRAAELINGSLVQPGEVWSFNETVGERTPDNGFVDGTMILDGRYQSAPGGGVSAMATTVFNAMFFAGVKPVEYGAHSFYIERYPAGREATVAWGSLDLKFRNDSGKPIYIKAGATDSSVTVSFLGTKKYDSVEAVAGPRTNETEPAKREGTGETCVPQPPLEGFDISVDRVFKDGGAEVKRETFTTHYTPRDEVTCK
ncbi:VanW family protein [Streptomyces gardneri]|uniref:VanW family protein n=1 Tax=Streptomyces gardneri TaxID=66892 RepID=UPI0006BD00D8|nr:VanW family protein [Streptomyces gardneri]QPK43976.1 VanW family protein [Streptomyces gardneri]WRK35244.1 VanW family protein [Streptomyces venezuelae]CUM43173.1 Vancomycin B-type resistance protein VanW [Streptomyces venezuelae]